MRQGGLGTVSRLHVTKREAESAMYEREQALLKVECPLCSEFENDDIVLVPCGHRVCSKCILKQRSAPTANGPGTCQQCGQRVKKIVRVRR